MSTNTPNTGWGSDDEEVIDDNGSFGEGDDLVEAPARRGGTATELRRAAGGKATPSAARPLPDGVKPSQAGAGRGVVNHMPAAVRRADAPLADRQEAIDDAVDRIELGAPADQVFGAFAKMGVSKDEIIARGRQLGGKAFAGGPGDLTPATAPPAEPVGTVTAVEPTALEGVANFGRRVAERGGQAATGALAAAGVISPESAAASLSASQKRMGAAAPGSDIARGIEAFGQVKTFGDAFRAIADNPAATGVVVAESAALILPIMAVAAFAGLPAAGTVAVAGGVSGALEFGSTLTDMLGDKGIDARDVGAVEKALKDPAFMAEVRKKGAIRGLSIGAIDALTAGMAGRFIEPVMMAAKAGRISAEQAARQAAGAATKELSMQMAGGAGGESLAQALTGEDKPFDVVIEALAEGVGAPTEVASNVRGAGRVAGAMTPEAQFARALGQDVDSTFFKAQPIDDYARAAMSPQAFDPSRIDPTIQAGQLAAERAQAPSPDLVALRQVHNQAIIDSGQYTDEERRKAGITPAAPAVPVVPRVEDMPTTPLTPDQIVTLAAQAQASKAQQQGLAADPADLRRRAAGLRAVGVPELSLVADQMDAQAAQIEQIVTQQPVDQDRLRRGTRRTRPAGPVINTTQSVGNHDGSTPPAAAPMAPHRAGPAQGLPTIERGALAAQAQQALAARKAAQQQPGLPRQPESTTEAVPPQAPQLVTETGSAGAPPRAADTSNTSAVQREPAAGAAALPPDRAGQGQGGLPRVDREVADSAGGESLPTFGSNGQAVAWLAERRRAGDLVPVEAGDRWVLRARSTPAEAVTNATPTAKAATPAQQQTASTPSADAQATGAGVVAQHLEGSRAPDPATKAVIADSMVKAAANEGRKPSVMRSDLVAQVDQAMASASDETWLPAWKQPTKEQIRQAMVGYGVTNEARVLQLLEQRHQNLVAEQADRIGHVEFDVPGDGRFKVLNTKSALAEFRRKVEASPGFKDRQAQPKADGATGGQRGSPSVKAAIEAMLDEGDAQAAVDYAAAKGINIKAIGLAPSRLAKVAEVTPTADAVDADADADAAPAPAPAPAPARNAVRRQPASAPSATAPASPSAPDPLGLAGKMPHELTSAQFTTQVTIARTGDSKTPWTATWRGQPVGDDDGTTAFASRKAAAEAVKAAHRRSVQRAQQRGDAVPDDVKAEYADPREAGRHTADSDKAEYADARASTKLDKADIDRQLARIAADGYAALEGREISIELHILDTNEPAIFRGDAARVMRFSAAKRDLIDQGRLPDTEFAAEALARYLRSGLTDDQARAQAIRDAEVSEVDWQANALEALREQHPDLFTDRIDDAGEKIGGSRKDRWAERGLNVADLDDMSESEGAQLVTKAAVWKPAYAAMVEAGATPGAAAMVKVIVDQLAAQPKTNTPEGRRDYVTALQAVREVYGAVKTEADINTAEQKLHDRLGIGQAKRFTPEWDAARRVLFSVYKGRSDPFALGYNSRARASKLVADGFPAAVEPWTRRLVVRSIGGGGITPRGIELYMAEAEKLGTPLTAEQLRGGAWRVTDKAGKVQAYAPTKADADAAAKTVYESQRGTPDGKVEPERPHLDKLVRDGLPKAIDRDVKGDDFIAEFGFRGVEWGNWAAQDERQKIANLAFDGLTDLAAILNVPPKALSLNGTLGMAFGARGGGRFAAHYEPGKLVINITKLNGAGSLAHEFAHAFDHYLGELDRDDAYKTLPRGASGWYSEGRYDGKAERRMVQGADGRWTPSQQRRLANLRPELADRIDGVMRALFTGQQSKADMLKEFDGNIARAETLAVKSESDAGLQSMYRRQVENLRQARAEIASDPEGTTYPKGRSQFAAEAQKLSGKSSKGYWLRPTEMFARAFESYVFDRLVAMGAKSEYLVHGVESERYASTSYRGNPYPSGEERAAINKAFDALVAELKTRTGDDGKVALFQRRIDDSAEREALRALSQNDELFALPKSDKATVAEIAAEIDPTIKHRETVINSQETMHRLTMPDGSFAFITVRKANPYGPSVYGYDGENADADSILQRPGENPEDVDPDTSDVWVDVSSLKAGGAGALIYNIAATFAHNTGRILIGDPAGLSDEALRRRPEQMLSSALKYGTTAHLAPHPRQTVGAPSLGVPALKWVYGDHLGNIRRLIELNLDALQNAGLDEISFDPSTGRYSDSNGQQVGRDGIGAWVDIGYGRAALAGSRTIARGAVLRALVREEGTGLASENGGRDGLLARLVRLASESVGSTRGIFYSRTVGADTAGLTTDGVRAVVDDITRTWANAPGITVIATMSQAPAAAQRENARQLAEGASGVPAAFWLDNRVFLVASELQSADEVASAIAHEALGHHGLRGTFGPELDAVLADVARLRKADVRAKAEQYGLDIDIEAQRLRAAEEVLAELAQTEPRSSLVQRALAAIRNWLRVHIPALADLRLSDAELIERFIVPARRWVVEGDAGSTTGAQAAFQRDPTRQEVAPFYSQLSREIEGMSIKTAEAPVWQAQIRALTKRGTKAEEIDWSGVLDWLAMQTGKISKADVQAYLDANGVHIDEQVHGGQSAKPEDVRVEPTPDYFGPGVGAWSVMVGEVEYDTFADQDAADRAAADLRSDAAQLESFNGVRYPAMGQPGGTNARELVLSLPGADRFQSRHWPDTPNVLAHVRTSERSSTDGKRVLFVEELQSDWGDALRAARKSGAGGVEPGPFVRNDAWVALALKALVRHAVANGYEAVAFATGTQVAQAFPFAEESGTTRAARSRFYGESDGGVVDGRGIKIEATPVLHNVARDLLKKLGGDALQPMKLRSGPRRRPTAHLGFDITPALRKAAHEGLPLFARGKPGMADFRKWLQGADGKPLPLATNVEPNGAVETPTPSAETGARPSDAGFADWFAGSQITDTLGQPRLVYGVTNASGRFANLPMGRFGAGRYFMADAARTAAGGEVASFFSQGGVKPAFLSLKNPFVFEGARVAMPEGWVEPKGLSRDTLNRLHRSMRSPAAGLVQAVMPPSSAEQMLARLFHGKTDIGDGLTKRLKEMGHDGLVVRFADPQDGPETIVAFEGGQVLQAAEPGAGRDGPSGATVVFQRVAGNHTLRSFERAGRMVEVVQDRYNRWKQAIDDIREQGGTVTEASDFYRVEERYWGRVGSQIDAFEAEIKGFIKALAKDGLGLEDVALYAYAQHAEERNEYVASINPNMPDGGSGMVTDDADAILAEAQASGLEADLQRHAATLRSWIAGTRDVLRDGGLIGDDEYDAWQGAYTHYVPLRGLGGITGGLGTGKGFNIRGPEGQQAFGRRSQAKNIVEHIVQDRVRSLVRVGKNEVLRAFARFVMDNPSSNLWEVNAVETRPAIVVDENGDRTVVDRERVIADERTVTLKDGGVEIHILVKDPVLLAQLRHHGIEQNPAWPVASLLWANRLLSRLYTSLSPVFTVVNALRDAQTAAFGIIDEIGFLAAPKLFAKLPGALVESFAAEAGKKSGDYQLYEAFGGKTSFHALRTIDDQAAELQRLLHHEQRSAIDPRNAIPAAFKLIESINGGIENATRLAAFKVAREAGRSTADAASIAKNITVNFNRKGTQQLASAWFLFFNPAVQGTARIVQSLSHPKVQATLATAMLGVASLALRNAGMGDDDDGVAWWDKIPEEVKERNLIIILPPGAKSGEAIPKSKTGRYVKIPMPYGYNFFAVVANQVVDAWRHAQDPRRGRDVLAGSLKAFNAFMGSWLPVDDLGRALSPDSGEGAGKSAVLALVPDALDPMAQIGLNWSGFGRKLYPDDWQSRHMPDSRHYFPSQAGTVFQRGAEWLNESTGGSRFAPGWADVTPATLETLARAYGGGPASFALDLTNALYVRQNIERPDLDVKRLPFVRQAWGTIDAETDRLTGFQRLERAEKVTGPIERAIQQGGRAEARQMIDEAGPMARLGDAVQTTRERLADIRKVELHIINDRKTPDDIRYVRLETLAERRRKALQQFNVEFDKAVLATEAWKKERTTP